MQHVLVADDEADIRRLISYTLQRRGYRVTQAPAGDEALKLAMDEPPDLAVLDVTMPGLSGLEVTRELAARPATARVPVILVSANGQAAEIAAGLASGACAYIVKPFTPHELVDRVAAVLAGQPRG